MDYFSVLLEVMCAETGDFKDFNSFEVFVARIVYITWNCTETALDRKNRCCVTCRRLSFAIKLKMTVSLNLISDTFWHLRPLGEEFYTPWL